MSLITLNAKEYRSMHNKCYKIYLSGPFGIFCLYVIVTVRTCGLKQWKWHDVIVLAAPVQANRDFFWHTDYISSVSTFLNIRAFY